MPLEAYVMLLTVRLNYGQHAKCCSEACKHLRNRLLRRSMPVAILEVS
jgi:hypothetical protein